MNLLATARLRLEQLRRLRAQFGELIHKERRHLLLAQTAMFAEVGFTLLTPFPMKYLFDGMLIPREGEPLRGVPEGFPQERPELFLGLAVGAVLLFAGLTGAAAYLRQVWAATAGQRMVFKLRKRLYERLHRLPLSFHGDRHLGDLLIRITGDIPMLRDVLSESMIDLIGRFSIVFFAVIVLFFYGTGFGLVAIGVLVLTAVLSSVSARRIVKVARKQREKEGVLAYTAAETLAAVSLVKAYGREDEVVERFGRDNRSSMRQGLKATRQQAALSRSIEIVLACGLVAALLIGVPRALPEGSLRPGDLIIVVAYIRLLAKPIRRIARTSARIGKAAACAERVMEIMNLPPEEPEEETAAEPDAPLDGRLRFRGVGYRYVEDGPPAIAGIDLSIEPRERIGIVGRNGAGKSTLVSLVPRFFDPTEGEVLYDGRPGPALPRRWLRERISIVLQETYLFGSTIRENLHFAAPGVEDGALLAMLDRVGAGFVAASAEGLDAELTEGGKNLSGGERRKIALAGALLRPSNILILDEPTSNIDASSRDDLLARLPEVTEGRTTLVITHDPTLLSGLDRVVYLEEGRIVGCDEHHVLQRESDGYRALFPARRAAEEGDAE